MAKKARTPDPPRRPVQAPKARTGAKGGRFGAGVTDADRRRLLITAAIVAAAILAVGAVAAILVTRGGGDSAASKLPGLFGAAGCKYDPKVLPNEGRNHTRDLNEKITYKTKPPTSGTHYETPAPWDTYFNPLNPIQAVHNLEHGGIVVQYGSRVPKATVDQLKEFVSDDPRGMLMAPLPALGNRVALTAWRRLATCTAYDAAAFRGFRDAFRGKGPERFPLDAMEPRE